MMVNNLAGVDRLNRQIRYLSMTDIERKRVNHKLARKVTTHSRARIRKQQDLNGSGFTPRKNKARKGKMLRGLSRSMRNKSDSRVATVYFRGLSGRIAREHQEGVITTMTAARAEKEHGKPDYHGPASRKQAKALRAAGYKIRRDSGKGYKQPSIKWIVENMKNGQAGAALRYLLDTKSKKSWSIVTPKREFLGVTNKESSDMVDDIFNGLKQKIKR